MRADHSRPWNFATSSKSPSTSSNAATGVKEIARIGETVRADRTELRQAQQRAEVLGDVAARLAVEQFDAEADAARHRPRSPVARRRERPARSRCAGVPAAERSAVRRRRRRSNGPASSGWRHTGWIPIPLCAGRAAIAGHRDEAVDEVGRCRRQRQRIPAQLVRRRRHFVENIVEFSTLQHRERRVHRRGTDAIEPAAPIRMARRGERRARKLLGIESVGDALRRVAALGQRARERLGRKFVAEAGLVDDVRY